MESFDSGSEQILLIGNFRIPNYNYLVYECFAAVQMKGLTVGGLLDRKSVV